MMTEQVKEKDIYLEDYAQKLGKKESVMSESESLDLDKMDEDNDGLTKKEVAKCWKAFSAFDKDSSGKIDANELRIVLEMMGQKTTEEEIFKMISEVGAENTGLIKYEQFKKVIADQKKKQSLINEEDKLNTFLFLGNQPKGEGSIEARKLINPIKKDFEETIDIEKLIKDIDEDGSGEIEYGEFTNLLSSSDDIIGIN